MRRILMSALVVSGVAVPVGAQTTDAGYADALSTSLASVANAMHATIRRNLAEAAEAMPADEYSFRPTPQVRTFGQLIAHVAETNWFFCREASGARPPTGIDNLERIIEKAVLVKALNDSLAYCDQVYQGTSDANYNRPVHVDPNPGMAPTATVRGAVLTFNTAHNYEHYGNMVVYMRLKGHVPPSTARASTPK